MFQAKKAKRQRRPLKVSMEGLSGGGKTYTALRLAFDMIRRGIGKRVIVLDSENESASLYAGVTEDGAAWEYDVADIPPAARNPAGYAAAYEWAVGAGYDIVIVDSLSHAWHGALQDVDRYAASHRGDKLGGWAALSPQQQRMIQTLTDPRAHCICTMRVKSDFQDQDVNGKTRKVKVGMKADQRDNTEYEYDIVLRFEAGNDVYVEKVRGCSAMNGRTAVRPGPVFWKPLLDWWLSADAAPAPAKPEFDAKPAAAPASGNGHARPSALPADGKDLHQRLQDYDAKLAAQKVCPRGALLAHVTQAGVRAGYSPNLTEWAGPAIKFAADAVKEFDQAARGATPPAPTAFLADFGNRAGLALGPADLDALEVELNDRTDLTDAEYAAGVALLKAGYAKFPG